jgi:hypothetical protein
MAGPFDSISGCLEAFGVEVFYTVVCDVHGGGILLFDLENEKLWKITKERAQQLTPSSRG